MERSKFQIPLAELDWSFVRSSGPGGQNVNKVNSKAVLRWNLVTSPSIPDELKSRLLARLGPRLTRAGELLVTCDEFRDQLRNRDACLEKLDQILTAALHVPKARKKTRASRGTRERNKLAKSRHSDKKRLRRKSGPED
jgi:ribosome-associated protein